MDQTVKTKTLLILFVFLFVHLNAFAAEPLDDILIKHGLISKKKGHSWKVLDLQKKDNDLMSDDSQILWINAVTANIHKKNMYINPSKFLKYRSVQTILDKSDPLFQELINMGQAYDNIARDMEQVHQKASIFYNAQTDSPEEAKLKKNALKKVRKIYLSLRNNTYQIYKEGVLIESILKLLPDELKKARSLEMSDETIGMNFAHEYDLNILKFGRISVEASLTKSAADTNRILKESRNIFREALYELDRKF